MPTTRLWQPLFHVLCSAGAIPAGVQWDHLAGSISQYPAYRVMHFPKHLFLWRWHLGCSPWTLPAQLPGVTWAPALLRTKRQRKAPTLTVLRGQCGKLGLSTPLALWHIFCGLSCTHTSLHILGTGTCCQPARGVSVLAPLWKSPVPPCQDQLSCMHCSLTLEICPQGRKYRNHSRNLI